MSAPQWIEKIYMTDTSDWIDGVCEKFAADCKLDRIDSTFKRT